MASLDLVIDMLCLILGQQTGARHHMPASDVDFDSGNAKLARNATAILGPVDADRDTRIMVTMPGEAAENPALIHNLLARGMQVMRINCAHDNPLACARMVLHLRRAERRLGRQCKVSFDLAGPKLRTDQVESAPGVIEWRPQRDSCGRVIAPAVISFASSMTEPEAAQWTVPLIGSLSRDVRTGDTVELVDARGRKRRLAVVAVSGSACVCHADRAAYVTSEIKVRIRRGNKVIAKATIAELPARPQKIVLKPGDMLNLTRNSAPGRPAIADSAGKVIAPATIGCDVPEIFGQVKAGQRVFFDDGRFEGLIRQVDAERMLVEITSVTGGVGKLGAEKGINLPDSKLELSALTVQDK